MLGKVVAFVLGAVALMVVHDLGIIVKRRIEEGDFDVLRRNFVRRDSRGSLYSYG